jgi:hypothetical protein
MISDINGAFYTKKSNETNMIKAGGIFGFLQQIAARSGGSRSGGGGIKPSVSPSSWKW